MKVLSLTEPYATLIKEKKKLKNGKRKGYTNMDDLISSLNDED